ncbi:hypothetical protein ARALYDRAFT_897269 [Arabidopsis lyrata subsp. lyrata]|uniref:Uncharacterized protein n=1 Tax=Arabidopsis lyrata subsp. lyrata TaxID=81972 RepID=D7L9Q7_ARALL|nr:hypothetical protein ARALYDRAFT_897269 [Arabidopsis lyrata subsp. lyrata]
MFSIPCIDSCLRIIDTARCPSTRLIACSLKTDKLPLGAAVTLSGGPVVKRSLQKRQVPLIRKPMWSFRVCLFL